MVFWARYAAGGQAEKDFTTLTRIFVEAVERGADDTAMALPFASTPAGEMRAWFANFFAL